MKGVQVEKFNHRLQTNFKEKFVCLTHNNMYFKSHNHWCGISIFMLLGSINGLFIEMDRSFSTKKQNPIRKMPFWHASLVEHSVWGEALTSSPETMFDLIALSSEPREIGLFLSPNRNGSHSFSKYSLYAIIHRQTKQKLVRMFGRRRQDSHGFFFFFFSLFWS